MKKILFIDRDGTLIKEPPTTYQVDSLDQLELLPGVIRNLYNISTKLNYELVMVTNQDGLGTASNPLENFNAVQGKLLQILEGEDIRFSNIYIDGSFEHEQKETRKPRTGMLIGYMTGEYDIAKSFVIGDRFTDVLLAKNMGCGAIFIRNNEIADVQELEIDLVAGNWEQIYQFLKEQDRIVQHSRYTNETKIDIIIKLEGTGKAEISTGIGFFDHMLEQIARHGQMDLTIQTKGDLYIDEHHTIEDTGIALGEAFAKALGDKKGIERYGFCLPMDDCLAQIAIDLGGRAWLVWSAVFRRESIGGMPTEMFYHFFKSFSDAARCNINIKAIGTNEHHKIESIFKAFAKCLKMAVKKDYETMLLPTTKGTV
jgi:imidazoleglycerol-phosphate dehydratase/histidinol-phosphatase